MARRATTRGRRRSSRTATATRSADNGGLILLLGASTFFADGDGDGLGDAGAETSACAAPDGFVANADDCDDGDADVGAEAIVYSDGDRDGFGATDAASGCPGVGFAAASGDCDDADASVHPGAVEACDARDADCDGTPGADDPDNPDRGSGFVDVDGDGYGGAPAEGCDGVPADGDCDDGDAAVHPGATEACGAADDDCDGLVDEADDSLVTTIWYVDDDLDGFGAGDGRAACDGLSGEAVDPGDCDDTDPDVSPAGAEVCNGHDDDCDGDVDVDDADCLGVETRYVDRDADGWGDDASAFLACDGTEPTVGGDCEDGDAAIHPGVVELCDGDDNDCDGLEDDDDPDVADASSWYADADSDGHGDAASVTVACLAPRNTATSADDCDDGDSAIHPDATDVCEDGIDQDCDGAPGDCGVFGATTTADADGTRISVPSDPEVAGAVVARAGDVDADGYDDLWVGARYDDSGETNSGSVFLFAGPVIGSATAASADVTLIGSGASAYFGDTVAGGGDWDGDGTPDLFIDGDVYVGSSAIATLTPWSDGVRFAGDLDSDGDDELFVGNDRIDAGAASDCGGAYLISGGQTGTVSSAAAELDGEDSYAYAGESVYVGDVSGDGVPDFVVGARQEDSWGAAYVVYGPVSGTMSLATADVKLTWTMINERAGTAVAGGTDVDGDGQGDVLVGAPYYGSSAGAVYVHSGATLASGTLDNGIVRLVGVNVGEEAGTSVDFPGDVDGDGFEDLLVGAPEDDTSAAGGGAVYLLRGPVSAASTLADAVRISGTDTYGGLGETLAPLGDTDGDGFADFAVGEPLGNTTSGGVYIFLGLSY